MQAKLIEKEVYRSVGYTELKRTARLLNKCVIAAQLLLKDQVINKPFHSVREHTVIFYSEPNVHIAL